MFDKCKFCGNAIEVVNNSLGLVECQNCFLIFAQKKYSQDYLSDIYDHLYNDKNPQYKTHSVEEFEQLKQGKIKIGYNKKRLLKKYLKNNSRVLEIGSGVGLIGSYIKKKFPGSLYKGVEIDRSTNEKAKSFGLNVFEGDFTLIKKFNERFDVVLMWEVLEHIQDLKECIALINSKLSKGGVFIFSVPNYDKRLNYESPEDNVYTSGPPIHLNFFRKKSIGRIFELASLKIVELKKKRLPYLNLKVFSRLSHKILLGKFEGPTIYSVIRKE